MNDCDNRKVGFINHILSWTFIGPLCRTLGHIWVQENSSKKKFLQFIFVTFHLCYSSNTRFDPFGPRFEPGVL